MALPGSRLQLLFGILAALAVMTVGGLLIWRQLAGPLVPVIRNPDRHPDPPIPVELLRYRMVELPQRSYPTGAEAWGLALMADGGLIICGEQGLACFDAAGRTRGILAPDLSIRAVAVTATGTFLCCVGSEVVVLDGAGSETGRWRGFGPAARLDAIVIADAMVFVADGGQGQVWRLDGAGTVQASWGAEEDAGNQRLKIPGDWFDLDWDGRQVVVANPGRHRVQAYDPEGNLNGWFGHVSTTDLAGFVGCCNPVALACLPEGRILVTEKGISRVKILDGSGILEAFVATPDDFVEISKRRAFAIDVVVDAVGRIHLLENHDHRVLTFERKPDRPVQPDE